VKKNILNTISFFLILTYSPFVNAENRRFLYLNINAHENEKNIKNSTITISSLSPVALNSYIGGQSQNNSILLRTWYCPGETKRNFKCNLKKIFKN
jgi:hypothetical protein